MAVENQSYEQFISKKFSLIQPSGLNVIPDIVSTIPLKQHQKCLAEWAIRRGKAAIFADTGLGKSRMQITWCAAICEATGGDAIIVAPLAVAAQTVREAELVGVKIHHVREQDDVRPGICIVNYERLHKIDLSKFIAVALDESSIIKNHGGKMLKQVLLYFCKTPYKLCCTATPAPNDWTELGSHAEFLGVCTRSEMLSEYFVHDAKETQVWRLKSHGKQKFWPWVASWAALLRSPADLGFDASEYELPPINFIETIVQSDEDDAKNMGQLIPVQASTLMERRTARRVSAPKRVQACAEIVNASDQPWIVWCELNTEGDSLRKAIHGSMEITGSDDPDVKEENLIRFINGEIRVLITKPSIAGFGLNLQHCADVAFVGVTDSWESYYQAVRRCWRFGQKKKVNVHIFASEAEGRVVENLKSKESEAKKMSDVLSAETKDAVMNSVFGSVRTTNSYNANSQIKTPSWLVSE